MADRTGIVHPSDPLSGVIATLAALSSALGGLATTRARKAGVDVSPNGTAPATTRSEIRDRSGGDWDRFARVETAVEARSSRPWAL